MNRKRLIVALEDTVFAYDISNMRMLHSQLTPMNPTGICAISPSSENNYLVLPHYQKSAPGSQAQASHVPKAVSKENISGDVLIYDLNKMEEMTVVTAHQTAVSCLALSNDGRLLATASEKGTVIRIFSIPDGKKLYQFRRGSMPSRILSMSFNAASTLLCVSSATETVHIFRLAPPGQTVKPKASSAAASSPPPPRQGSVSPSTSDDPSDSIMPDEEEENSSKTVRSSNFMSMVRRTSQNVSNTLVSRAAGYLPSSVTEIWEPQRDFAWVRVPRGPSGASQKSVVAMGNQSPSIMVATNEGDFFVYSIDLEHGGEGTLVRQYHDLHGLRNAKGRDIDI
ncbi:hypothetical protein AMS68_004459 [Peltaster fructicola]|uniref:Autophagy-related protein 18 n=1 Tax=Peltaster fructicola TaxID=286661 RepID=A0A6H0XVZ3_9PEZI|nr:hypothetical protein AMS68_004459 [Peltaster fructicola]